MLLLFGYICGNAIFFQHNAVSHRFLTALIPFLTGSSRLCAASLSITRLLKIVDTPFYNFSLLSHCFNQTNTQKSVITHDRIS